MDRRRIDVGLVVLRLVAGIVFSAHGAQKLFVDGLPGVALSFTRMGIPLAAVSAVVVTLLEFVGGFLLLIGLFVTPVSILFAFEMLVAIVKVHSPRGFFDRSGGVEFPLLLLGIVVALALTGAGRWSVDGWVHGGAGRAGGAGGAGKAGE